MAVKQSECTHHWIIEPSAGPTSQGRCKLCHLEMGFENSSPTYGFGGVSKLHHAQDTREDDIGAIYDRESWAF